MNLARLAVQRPITTAMLLVSVLVLGGLAWARLPLAFLPEVDVPFISIQIPYPNSNPAQVEKEITRPVEEVLSTLSRVRKLSSTSTADGASLQLEFQWGEDLDVVRMQVSEVMEQVKPELPEGARQVLIYSFNTSDIPVIQGRIAAPGVDLSQNYDLLEARVINRIRRVPGVARVDLNGVEPREIYIDLSLDQVKRYGVDFGALVQRLQGASLNLVLGEVQDGGLRYTARAVGAFDSLDAIRQLSVDERGLTLGEIAEISYQQPALGFGRHLDGEYAVALLVYKESTANTVDVVRAITRVIEEDIDRDPLLQGIQLFVWQDQAEEITSGIAGLRNAGTAGALLALLVIYFFLRRMGSTLIVSLSIPFSVIAACGLLYFSGRTLNILSMTGLMLGIGMLVDNAIVVLEAIDRRMRDEPDRQKAALGGASSVAMAVTASTLTSLIVFLPLIVGTRTQLTTWLGEMGIAISLALVSSLFSSLTLIPLMSAHLLKARESRPSRLLTGLEERYARLLAWTLRHSWRTTGLVVLGLALGFLPMALGLVKAQPFSATVNKRLFLDYEFYDFFYRSEAEAAVTEVEHYLDAHRDDFGIASVYSYYQENEASTVITLAREDLDDAAVQDLRQRVRAGLPQLPGARVFFNEDAQTGGSSTYFAVNLFGQDSAELAPLAAEVERRLGTVAEVQDISSSLRRGRQEIQVHLDREKALRQGLSAQEVANIFSFTLGGLRLPRFNTGEREVDTWLALRAEDRTNLDDLRRLQVRSRDGRPVLLGDVARFEVVEKPEEIRREDRKVRVAVSATYEGKDWEATRKQVAGLMDSLNLPAGYSWSWNDRILDQDNQNRQMGVNFLLAVLLVYLVMASLFESLVQPLVILLSSLFFALPGAFGLLALTGTPFNLMAQIGLLILMGIVVNNGIVLLDHYNHLHRGGLPAVEAAVQAGRDRLRPILMTAATTILGLLPLALGGSRVGGLFYYPLARTVMGGLISSALLTLLVLPFLNLRFEAASAWARQVWRRSALGGTAGEAALPALDNG